MISTFTNSSFTKILSLILLCVSLCAHRSKQYNLNNRVTSQQSLICVLKTDIYNACSKYKEWKELTKTFIFNFNDFKSGGAIVYKTRFLDGFTFAEI